MKFEINPVVKIILQLALIALGLLIVFQIRFTLIYLVIAMVLTIIGKPLVNKLTGKKIGKHPIPNWMGALITLLLMLTVFIGLQIIIVPRVVDEVTVLSNIDFQELFDLLQSRLKQYDFLMQSLPFDLEAENAFETALFEIFNLENVTESFKQILGGVGNIAIASFSIIFILFFLLKEDRLADHIIYGLAPDGAIDKWKHIIPRVKRTLTRYLLALTVQVSVIFTTVFIGLSAVGVENVMVIALFAGFINLIPYVGPIIGFVFGLILGIGESYALNPDAYILPLAGNIILVFAVVQLIDNFITQPIIFGNSINATPLEIFLVISIAGSLGGIPGMVIAVPTYSVIRIFSEEFFPDSRIVKFVLGKSKYENPEGNG